MGFYGIGRNTAGNLGSMVLTLCTVILSFIVAQVFSEIAAQKLFGFSLASEAKNADANVVFTLMLFPFLISLLVLLRMVSYVHRQRALTLFTLREKFDWKRFFTALSMWGVFLFLILGINILFGEEIIWNFNPGKFSILLLISLTLLPVQTTLEEVLFRGYFFQQLSKVFPKAWISILITGIIFGLLHGANPEIAKLGNAFILYYIVTGIFLGVLTQLDGGLELSMGYHAINNIFAALILTNDWQVFQTDALFVSITEPPHSVEVILTICIVQPMLLFIFWRIYKWDNWKAKLFGR